MGQYTLELREIITEQEPLFNFEYDFYDNDLKPQFEKLFIDHYYCSEIGFETVYRFKHYLKCKLNEINPKYKQLYETQLACKDINFMLNKDLKETFIRENNKSDTNNSSLNNTSNSTSNNSSNGASNETTNYKESNINNGNANVSLNDGYLTGVNNNNSSNSFNSTDSNNSNSTSNSTTKSNGETSEREQTTLVSQGNIGITSSAELLSKWRETILNLNQDILEECHDLFMLIY